MAKVFKGAYMSVEEAAAAVEHLLADGYTPADVVVVTHRSNKGAIEGLTIANVEPVLDAENKSVSTGRPSLFSIADDNNPLGAYQLDPSVTERYNKTVQNGGYVILAEGTGKETAGTYLERSPIKEKSDPTIPNIGEKQEQSTSEIQNTTNEGDATSVDGIPVKESDGNYGGHMKSDITNVPPTPGADDGTIDKP